MLSTTINAQSVSGQDQQQEEEKEQQPDFDIFVLNYINGGMSSTTREFIDDALVYNLGEDFERMTPLQKKNYLASEEGKNIIASIESYRKFLFSATWCFGFELEGNNSSELKNVFYHLGHEKMMLRIGDRLNDELLKICGDQFKFNKNNVYIESFTIVRLYFLGLPCSEEVATEIENNNKDLVLYLYFKVPDMNAVTIEYGKPHLAVKVDKVELRNKETGETYITTVM